MRESYWKKIIEDTSLQNKNILCSEREYNADGYLNKNYILNKTVTQQIFKVCNHSIPSMYIFFLAVVSVLYGKYGDEEYVIGCHPLKSNQGMAKVLPMFQQVDGQKTAHEIVNEIRQHYVEIESNKDISMNQLIEILYNKLKEQKFVIETTVIFKKIYKEENYRFYGEKNILVFDINGDDITVDFYRYKKESDSTYCDRLMRHLEQILAVMTETPECLVKDISLMTAEDRKRIDSFNDTAYPYEAGRTFNEIFLDTVGRHPDSRAMIFQGEHLTYRELEERSRRVAVVLRDRGIGRNGIVALYLNRSFEMLTAILGVVRAGGAYMPILPSYPKERAAFMVEDSGAHIILTSRTQKAEVTMLGPDVKVLAVEELLENGTEATKEEAVCDINQEDDTLYVIYTSGSTGKPKGVMVSHKALINRIEWMQRRYPIGEKDVIMQKTSYCFDVSVWELLWGSFTGAALAMLGQGDEMVPERIFDLIGQEQVTVMHFVPSMLAEFLRYYGSHTERKAELESLSYIFSSGEALAPQLVEKYNRNAGAGTKSLLVNLYGPTEAAIDVTYYDCVKGREHKKVPIGRPIENIRIQITDGKQRLLPIGIAGELCIAGIGLAKGYLNREELTAEKFCYNEEMGERVYRTGDLARWLDDGNIEYLSRMDGQVKVRGFRIELGEIEKALEEMSGVHHAAVLAEKGEVLAAYVVKEQEPEFLEIRKRLKRKLPYYMVPTHYARVEKIPVTSNGKLDRKKLLETEAGPVKEAAYVKPQEGTEETVAQVFAEVLGSKGQVGALDSFFDLGGHSLKAVELSARLYEEFGKPVEIKDVFERDTVRALAAYLETMEEAEAGISEEMKLLYGEIEKVGERELYETSPAQKRMFILQQAAPESTAYNMPVCLEVKGEFDLDRAKKAFEKLLLVHEILRTTFELKSGNIYQRVQENVKLDWEQIDVKDSNEDKVLESFIKPFKLGQDSLFRVGYVKLSENDVLLCIDMHHIISDGKTINILIEDFMKEYQGIPVKQGQYTYKDYAVWSNQLVKSEVINSQKNFFVERLSGIAQGGTLPKDYPFTLNMDQTSTILTESMGAELSKQVQELLIRTKQTDYMVLAAALVIVLKKYTNQNSIVIGSPVEGRRNTKVADIAGLFVNTIAIRFDIDSKTSILKNLDSFSQSILEAFNHQDCPFDEIVNALGIDRKANRNPLFSVMFAYQESILGKLSIDGLEIKEKKGGDKTGKFDLNISAYKQNEEIFLDVEYKKALYKESTILRFITHFKRVLEEMVTNGQETIAELHMLTEEEMYSVTTALSDKKVHQEKLPLIQSIRNQAAQSPKNTAIISGNVNITYSQLDKYTNKIANMLIESNIGKNDRVAVLMNRSAEFIIAVIGVLKANATYIPIDASYPKQRVQHIINNASPNLIITNDIPIDEKTFQCPVEDIRSILMKRYSAKMLNKDNGIDKDRSMYILYTSGSTGMPKGVEVRLSSFENMVNWYIKDFNITKDDNSILVASIGFDLAQKNLFASLMVGGKITVFNGNMDVAYLLSEVERSGVTMINCTPSMFYPLIEYNSQKDYANMQTLRYVYLGGEPINLEKIRPWIESGHCKAEVVNTYGPTECTDIASFYRISKEDYYKETNVPIGKAIDNVLLYVLDKDMCILPKGCVGELYIGGNGVSKGYYQNPKMTAERFLQCKAADNQILYKTGDIVKIQEDGYIEYLGREDNQVKVRGFRIELGEIETVLNTCSGVKESVVICKDMTREKVICAFIELENGNMDIRLLKDEMKQQLPDYMIPAHFTVLDKIPCSANGKLDRKTVAEMDVYIYADEKQEVPKTEIEKFIVDTWKNVLEVENIYRYSSYFELGGNSLNMLAVYELLSQRYSLELQDLYQYDTVAELADYLTNLHS